MKTVVAAPVGYDAVRCWRTSFDCDFTPILAFVVDPEEPACRMGVVTPSGIETLESDMLGGDEYTSALAAPDGRVFAHDYAHASATDFALSCRRLADLAASCAT